MSITHVVMFQFKANTSADVVKDVSSRMLALKDNCIHPTSQAPYMISSKGGTDNSPEGMQNGMTHAFVMEFANAEDRDYYIKEDPTHLEFIKDVLPLIEKAVVLDFQAGVFAE